VEWHAFSKVSLHQNTSITYLSKKKKNTSITLGVIATKSFLVVLDILLLLQVKSRCDSNLKIGKLLQQHKLVAITYNNSLH
jgi:hypothetical protein